MPTFFATVFTIIAHTPLWVWPLYGVLLFLGFQRTRASIIPLWRMLILPIVVALLAILSFILAGMSALPAALFGLVIGGPAGWFIERDGTTRRLSDGSLWLRGEWLTLVQIVLVLVFRYATSVTAGLSPALNGNLTWQLGTVFIATTLSSMFLGRTTARLRVYFGTEGAFRPVMDSAYPLANAAEAHPYVGRNLKRDSVVLGAGSTTAHDGTDLAGPRDKLAFLDCQSVLLPQPITNCGATDHGAALARTWRCFCAARCNLGPVRSEADRRLFRKFG